jgi:arabinan endo-1,5-alpha-L-arabinosidase
MLLKVALSLAAFAIVVVAQPEPNVLIGFTNAHDPSICKAGDTWYAFTTAPGISILTSPDRKNWQLAGVMWPGGANWTDAYTGQRNANLWAPECYYTGSKFLVSVFES